MFFSVLVADLPVSGPLHDIKSYCVVAFKLAKSF